MSLINFLPREFQKLLDHDGLLFYQENFIDRFDVENLISEITWQQDEIKMFGKIHPLPRLTAFYGDQNIEYTYSGIKMVANLWSPILLEIKSILENEHHFKYNSVLINYYRNGLDHMSFHSDDELSLGRNPTIASISFGEPRKFVLKHRFDESKFELVLNDKSLLIMAGELQHFWVHKISKKAGSQNPRVNLTFRNIIQ